jgi:hypothetical protein
MEEGNEEQYIWRNEPDHLAIKGSKNKFALYFKVVKKSDLLAPETISFR